MTGPLPTDEDAHEADSFASMLEAFADDLAGPNWRRMARALRAGADALRRSVVSTPAPDDDEERLAQALYRVLYNAGVSFESGKVIPMLTAAVRGVFGPVLPIDEWEYTVMKPGGFEDDYAGLPTADLGTALTYMESYSSSGARLWRQRSASGWEQFEPNLLSSVAPAAEDDSDDGVTLIDELNATINWLKRTGSLHDASRVQRAVAALEASAVSAPPTITDEMVERAQNAWLGLTEEQQNEPEAVLWRKRGSAGMRAALRAALGGEDKVG